jgi:uncharacterized small protein (DUF1192 family)
MSHLVTNRNILMKVLLVSSTRQTMESDLVSRLFSVRLVSPIVGAAGGSQEDQPAQLSIPTLSHPSYSFPSAPLAALESRILQLEKQNMAGRVAEVEVAVAGIPVLKASAVQIPALQDEVKRLGAECRKSEAKVSELEARMAGLETQVKGLIAENVGLKDQVSELEARLHSHDETRDISMMSSVIFHSPPRAIHSPTKEIPPPKANDVDDHGKDVQIEVAVGSGVAPTYAIPLPNSSHY